MGTNIELSRTVTNEGPAVVTEVTALEMVGDGFRVAQSRSSVHPMWSSGSSRHDYIGADDAIGRVRASSTLTAERVADVTDTIRAEWKRLDLKARAEGGRRLDCPPA